MTVRIRTYLPALRAFVSAFRTLLEAGYILQAHLPGCAAVPGYPVGWEPFDEALCGLGHDAEGWRQCMQCAESAAPTEDADRKVRKVYPDGHNVCVEWVGGAEGASEDITWEDAERLAECNASFRAAMFREMRHAPRR